MSLAMLEQLLGERQRLHEELLEVPAPERDLESFETTVNRLQAEINAIDRQFPIIVEDLVRQRVDIPWDALFDLNDSVLRHLSRHDETAGLRLRSALKAARRMK
jgi:hypothetical protein